MSQNKTTENLLKGKKYLELNNLNTEELRKRYLLKKAPNEIGKNCFVADFNESLNRPNPSGDNYLCPLSASLMGVNLDTITTRIAVKIEPFLAENTKLNTNKFCEDLERLLAENKDLTAKAAGSTSAKPTEFVTQVADFFVYILLNKMYNNIVETTDTF